MIPRLALAIGVSLLAWPFTGNFAVADESPNAAIHVVVPSPGGPVRLRIDFPIEGLSPNAAWNRFLDGWFAHFDFNNDGRLDPDETRRVLAVPGADGKLIVVNFARADADNDGVLSRAEFKQHCRDAGFTPIVAIVRPPSEETAKASAVLFDHLDQAKRGELTLKEFSLAADSLRRFDENDDEAITSEELRSPELTHGKSPLRPITVEPGPPNAKSDFSLAVKSLGVSRHQLGGNTVVVDSRNLQWKGPARVARDFCLAQYQTIRGDDPHVTLGALEDDPSARLLVALFDAADRDRNRLLTPIELESLLDRIEEGARCQFVVAITDRGRNLFDLLDANGDARLDYRELHGAGKRIAGFLPSESIRRDQFPFSLRVVAQQGSTAKTFGPVPLTSAPVAADSVTTTVREGPRWFQATDRNRDGMVSQREFIGPAAAFRRLDLNDDGVIDAEESQAADR